MLNHADVVRPGCSPRSLGGAGVTQRAIIGRGGHQYCWCWQSRGLQAFANVYFLYTKTDLATVEHSLNFASSRLRSLQRNRLLLLLWAVAFAWGLGVTVVHAASWWDCQWFYRSEITVSASAAATDYAVKVELQSADFHSAYSFSTDGDDIRVIDADDSTELEFFLEQWDGSARKAVISVKVPLLSSTPRTLYIYYGNVAGVAAGLATDQPPAVSDAVATFVESGWRMHTRVSSLDPTNEAEARQAFNNIDDTASGYGCAVIDGLSGRNNRNTFNGPNGSYGLLTEVYFSVDIPGVWSFRMGSDYGRGGGLFVDGVALDERWNEDLWWGNNFNHPDVLSGSIHLENGFHHIEALGYEGCCDGTINMQYKTPGSATWLNMDVSNLTLYGRSCPPGVISQTPVATTTPTFFSGSVFYDNGSGGVAHDGVRHSAETGVVAIDVTASVVATGSNLTDQTDAAGKWAVCFLDEAAGSSIDISASLPVNLRSVSESTTAVNINPDVNSRVVLNAVANTDYTDIQFGVIATPELTADGFLTLGANGSNTLAHVYTATSTAELSFQVSTMLQDPAVGFTHTAFLDNNCDGVVEQPPVSLSNPVAVLAGDTLCIVIEVSAGPAVDSGSILKLQVDAVTDFNGIDLEYQNTNIDEITGQPSGRLVLDKRVCNSSSSSCSAVTGADFGYNNVGVPGDTLRYKITFSTVQGSVTEVMVSDSVPLFTTLEPLSIATERMPAGVNCALTSPVDQSISNYKGKIEWSCSGAVSPSDPGILTFTVVID